MPEFKCKSYTELLLIRNSGSKFPEPKQERGAGVRRILVRSAREKVRSFLEEMLRRGELKTVNEIFDESMRRALDSNRMKARRTTAIGLGELAEPLWQRRWQRS